MKDKFNYELTLTMESEVIKLPEESRKLGALRFDFSADGDELILNENGIKEGEVVRDAISILKKNLIDVERKKPKSKTVTSNRSPRQPSDNPEHLKQ